MAPNVGQVSAAEDSSDGYAKYGKLFRKLLNDSSWLARRVERVDLLDSDGSRHFVSLDINVKELEKKCAESGIDLGEDYLELPIPLGLVEKSLYLDFDVRDIDGRSLSLLTSDENSELAKSVIVATAREASIPIDDMDQRLIDHIKNIAQTSPSDRDLKTIIGMEKGRHGKVRAWQVPATFRDAQDDWFKLFSEEECLSWFISFTRAFMPVVNIPLPHGRSRTIIKYSFLETDSVREASLFRNSLWPVRIGSKKWRKDLKEAVDYCRRVTPEHLSLRPRAAFFEIKGIGFATRDHVRILAPEGTFFTDFELYESEVDDEGDVPVSAEISTNPAAPNTHYTRRLAPSLLVVNLKGVPQANWTIEAYFRPTLDGFVLPAIVTALATTIILLGGGIHQLISSYLENLMYSDGVLNNNAVSTITLLLLIPTILSAFVARGGEHQLRSESLFWLRVGVGCSGTATAVAALILITGVVGWLLGIIWVALGLVGLGVLVVLVSAHHFEKIDRSAVVAESMKTIFIEMDS